MSRYDPDDDDERGSSYGGSGSSRSHGKSHDADIAKDLGKTTSLKDAVAASSAEFANEDFTRFFGLKLSPNVASTLRLLHNQMLPIISDKIDKNAAKAIFDMAERQVGHVRAKDLAHAWGPRVGWLAVFAEPAFSVAGTFASAMTQLNETRRTLAPIVQATGNSKLPQFDVLFSSGNPMVDAMRAKVLGQAKERLIDAVVRGVSVWPTVMMRMNSQHEQMKQFDEEILRKELKDAQDNPEEFAKKIGQQFNDKWKVSLAQQKNWQAIEKEIIESHMKDFGAWKEGSIGREAKKQFETKVKEAFGNIQKYEQDSSRWDTSSYKSVAEALSPYERQIREAGFIKVDTRRDNKTGKTTSRTVKLDTSGKAYKAALEDQLKWEYAQSGANQPLDESWIPKEIRNGYGREKPKTKLQTAKEQFDNTVKSIDEDNRKKLEGKDEKHGGISDLTKQAFAALGTVTSELLGGITGAKGKKAYEQPCATELLIHLEGTLAEAKSQDAEGELPNRISGVEVKGKVGPDMSYAEIVHRIFQENQRFLHHPIDDRHFDHLKDIMGDDEKVQKAPDDELNAYEFAVKHISKRIHDERLSPGALYVLVTDKRRRIVQPDGKRFGPDGSYTDDKRAKAAITKELDELGLKLKPQLKASADQVNEAEADFAFDELTLKQAFGPQGLKGEQRVMLFLLVDHHLQDRKRFCEMSGVNDGECAAMEKKVQAMLVPTVDALTAEIADMVEHKNKNLVDIEITDDEQKLVADMNRVVEKGEHVQDVASREQRRTLEALLASAIVKFKDGNFWQNVVKRTRAEPKSETEKDDAGDDHRSRHADRIKKSGSRDEDSLMDDFKPHTSRPHFDDDDAELDDEKPRIKHTDRIKHGKHKDSGVDYSMPV